MRGGTDLLTGNKRECGWIRRFDTELRHECCAP